MHQYHVVCYVMKFSLNKKKKKKSEKKKKKKKKKVKKKKKKKEFVFLSLVVQTKI